MSRAAAAPEDRQPSAGAGSDAGPDAGSGAAAPPSVAPVERAGARRHVAMFGIVAFLIALDLWSKGAIFAWMQDPEAIAELPRSERGHPRYPLIGDWLGFMLNLNYGAAFGKGDSMPWLLVGGRCVAAVFLTFLIWRTPKGQPVYLASLVLILSGALGNLYDNFFYRPDAGDPGAQPGRPFGPVRDFIDVYFYGWDWHFPTFNIADSCITVGAVLLLLTGLFGPREASSTAPDAAGSSDAA